MFKRIICSALATCILFGNVVALDRGEASLVLFEEARDENIGVAYSMFWGFLDRDKTGEFDESLQWTYSQGVFDVDEMGNIKPTAIVTLDEAVSGLARLYGVSEFLVGALVSDVVSEDFGVVELRSCISAVKEYLCFAE